MQHHARQLPHETITTILSWLVTEKDLKPDRLQHEIAEKLDSVLDTIISRRMANKPWFARSVLKNKPAPIKGAYIYGPVGRGKTMLMDMLAQRAEQSQIKIRREHYHSFMKNVHQEIAARRIQGEDSVIEKLAKDLTTKIQLLCLDEFFVEDITDAMILSRLFTALFANGLILITTSNTKPENLYKDGLSRDLFLPFIDILKIHTHILRLIADTDYRMQQTSNTEGTVPNILEHCTSDKEPMRAKLNAILKHPLKPLRTQLDGRPVTLNEVSQNIVSFEFEDYCNQNFSAANLFSLVEKFDVFIIKNIPQIHTDDKNKIRRFISLIDVLYDQSIPLIANIICDLETIYPADLNNNESRAMARTLSRINEMKTWILPQEEGKNTPK